MACVPHPVKIAIDPHCSLQDHAALFMKVAFISSLLCYPEFFALQSQNGNYSF